MSLKKSLEFFNEVFQSIQTRLTLDCKPDSGERHSSIQTFTRQHRRTNRLETDRLKMYHVVRI